MALKRTLKKELEQANNIIYQQKETIVELEKQLWKYKAYPKINKFIESSLDRLEERLEWVFLSVPEPTRRQKTNGIRKIEVFNTKYKKKKILTFYMNIEKEAENYEEIHREYRATERHKEATGLQLNCDAILEQLGYIGGK